MGLVINKPERVLKQGFNYSGSKAFTTWLPCLFEFEPYAEEVALLDRKDGMFFPHDEPFIHAASKSREENTRVVTVSQFSSARTCRHRRPLRCRRGGIASAAVAGPRPARFVVSFHL